MTVFVSRFRRTYLRRRSVREMLAITLGFVLFVLLLGRVGWMEEQDRAVVARKDSILYGDADWKVSDTCRRQSATNVDGDVAALHCRVEMEGRLPYLRGGKR